MELSDALLKVLEGPMDTLVDFPAYLKTHPQLAQAIERVAHAYDMEACQVMTSAIAWMVNAIQKYGLPHDLCMISRVARVEEVTQYDRT